jgi:hypothetical protein
MLQNPDMEGKVVAEKCDNKRMKYALNNQSTIFVSAWKEST